MASYPAVIELRVDGITQVTRVLDTITKLDNALVSIKKTPIAIDSKNAVDGIRVLKTEVTDFLLKVSQGKAQLASTTAGLRAQTQAFRELAANATITGEAFKIFTQGAEQARQKVTLKGGLAELKALTDLYNVGRTAATQSFMGVEELLSLNTKLPKSTAALDLYKTELERVLSLVEIGSKEYRDLEAAIAGVNRQLDIAKSTGAVQGPAAAAVRGATQYQFPIGPNPRSTRRFAAFGEVSADEAERALIAKEKRILFEQEKRQLIELDRIRAANNQRELSRLAGLGKAIRGSLSSAAIGGAFPLLFGQSPQAAVGGALGGLLGGQAGGFAGSLVGTALGEIEATKARVKELSLELGLSAQQAKILGEAFQLAGRNSLQLEAAVTNIQGLGLSTRETASAIKIAVELSKEYGGSVEKVAQAFADTLESGKVSISTLNKFTAQGIPIQEQLATKLGVNRTKLLEMAKDGRISVQQVTDALVEMGRQAESTTDKGANGFDRFTQAVSGIATAIAGAAGAILKNLIPALDAVLSKLAAIITRATTALSLIADAQVGEASAALFRAGATRGTFFGMFAQSKGVIDDLTGGLKTLNPLLAKNQDELDKFSAVAGRYQKELQNYGGQVGEYSVKTAQVELSRVKNDIARRAAQLGAPKPAGLTIEDIVAPANLPPSGTKGAGKEKGKTALQNSIKRTEALKVEAQTLLLAAGIQDKINAAERIGAEQLALRLGFERDRAKLIGEYAAQEQKLANTANKNEEALALRKKRNAELVALQLKYENESAALDVKRLAPGYERQTQLQQEAYVLQQTLLGKGEEARLQVDIANAVKDLDATQSQAVADQMRKNFELQKQLDIAMQMKQLYTDIGMTIKDGVVGAIQGAIDGTKTLQQVATDVLTSIANKLLDVAINMALFGALSGAGTGGGLLGGLFPNIFQKRASGGSVMGGTPYMVGERGPELFVPGRSGTIVPNSSMGSTGATNVVVNVDASGSNVQGSDGQAGQLGKAIGIAVQQELIKQKRPGGLLAGV